MDAAFSEEEVVQILMAYCRGLFPRQCTTCQREFPTVRDYVTVTHPLGPYISYDVQTARQVPAIGTLALSNCPCGNTLSLSTDGLPIDVRTRMLEWTRAESQRRGISAGDVLADLRMRLRREILARAD